MKWAWVGVAALMVTVDSWLLRWWWVDQRERRAEVSIAEASRRYGVDPTLVKAVVWRESRFREDARGRDGELGLMQVGRLAALEWAEAERLETYEFEHLMDPRTNTLAGTWYLAKLLRRYPQADRPEAFALADYNAGRANVLRWIDGEASTNAVRFLEGMDFGGTRAYVKSVLERWEHYRGSAGAEP